jgi:hypothetical protein
VLSTSLLLVVAVVEKVIKVVPVAAVVVRVGNAQTLLATTHVVVLVLNRF